MPAGLIDFLNRYSDPKWDYMNYMVQQEAEKQDIDPYTLKALLSIESRFDPNARSKKGAVGLSQLMPRTAQSLGVSDRTNPQESIAGGAEYLKSLINRFGSLDKALGAYNYGPTNVARRGSQGRPLPRQVRNFSSNVKNQAVWLGKEQGPTSLFDYLNIKPLPENYGLRSDGTPKGTGFLGELKRPDGRVSTELSIGVNMDGKETLIPTLVPTLDKNEIDYLLKSPTSPEIFKTPMGQTIMKRAVEHARKRISEGKSPFAQKGE